MIASLERWQNSEIVENKFIWVWDARPYPYWPSLRTIWADGENLARDIGFKANLVLQL